MRCSRLKKTDNDFIKTISIMKQGKHFKHFKQKSSTKRTKEEKRKPRNCDARNRRSGLDKTTSTSTTARLSVRCLARLEYLSYFYATLFTTKVLANLKRFCIKTSGTSASLLKNISETALSRFFQ